MLTDLANAFELELRLAANAAAGYAEANAYRDYAAYAGANAAYSAAANAGATAATAAAILFSTLLPTPATLTPRRPLMPTPLSSKTGGVAPPLQPSLPQ